MKLQCQPRHQPTDSLRHLSDLRYGRRYARRSNPSVIVEECVRRMLDQLRGLPRANRGVLCPNSSRPPCACCLLENGRNCRHCQLFEAVVRWSMSQIGCAVPGYGRALVLVVDTNALVYAADQDSFSHAAYRDWLEHQRRRPQAWNTNWPIIYEFLRATE